MLLFLLGFLAARWLRPDAWGVYRTAFAFVGFFRLLPDFGMSYASTLAISRDRSIAASLVGNLLGFQALLTLLTLALCLGIGFGLYSDDLWLVVVILSVDLALKAVKTTLRWLLKSFEKFGTEAVSLLVERSLILLLGAALLLRGHGVIAFVLVFVAVRLFDATGLYAYVSTRVVRLVPRRDPRLWLELFCKGLPFAYAGVMVTLLFQIDQVMLERMRGLTEAGWYGAPVLVLEGLTLIPRVIGYAFLPTMAALHVKSPQRVTTLLHQGVKYLLLVGLPISAFGLVAAHPFVMLVFGADYLPSALAIRWLLPAALFMFLSNLGETTLACIGRWRAIVIISTCAVALNIALNFILIPSFGFLGAARATLVCEGFYFAATLAALARYGHRVRWWTLVWRPLIALLPFALTLMLTPLLTLIPTAILAGAVYLITTAALGAWGRNELSMIRSLVRGD